MTIWFTSDTHFGHKNIITYCNRPFDSVDEMNEVMVDRWNDTVSPDDQVFHLGDVAMGKIDQSIHHVSRLNGYKYLIPGNHDRCWAGNRKRKAKDYDLYTDVGFQLLSEHEWLAIGKSSESLGRMVGLNHMPYEGDSHDADRFTDWRPPDRGGWLIHGHVHDKWKVNDRQLNVGVDVWDFRPVSEAQVLEIIAA